MENAPLLTKLFEPLSLKNETNFGLLFLLNMYLLS